MTGRLRVGIAAVGTELLLGDQLDTNSGWLSTRLREVGADVVAHLAAGDELAELVPALRFLVERCDVLLVGGGLGPTQDDRTREAVARVAGVDLRSREDLEEALVQRFASFGRRMPASNLRQAQLPEGAEPFAMQGTAPGFGMDVPRGDGGTCWVAAMPGVPWEMQAMYDADVAPVLVARTGGGVTVTRRFIVTGMGEASVGEALADVERQMAARDDTDLSYLAKKGEIHVRLTGRAATREAAHELVAPFMAQALEVLGPVVGALDGETLESTLVRELTSRGQTVATSESATAGGIAARLATVPGASAVLLGGLVLYDTDAKWKVGGVHPDFLDPSQDDSGPVSTQATIAMARAVRERFEADWGVALTGVAGPDTQGGRDVGHTVVAVAGPDGVEVREGGYPGDRASVQRRMTTSALELLRRVAVGGRADPGDGR